MNKEVKKIMALASSAGGDSPRGLGCPHQASFGHRSNARRENLRSLLADSVLARPNKLKIPNKEKPNVTKRKEKQIVRNQKRYKLKTIIMIAGLSVFITNCSTTKHRDEAVVKSLKVQNDTIQSLITQQSGISKEQNMKALVAIHESNEVIISKLKNSKKKECRCGKN